MSRCLVFILAILFATLSVSSACIAADAPALDVAADSGARAIVALRSADVAPDFVGAIAPCGLLSRLSAQAAL